MVVVLEVLTLVVCKHQFPGRAHGRYREIGAWFDFARGVGGLGWGRVDDEMRDVSLSHIVEIR